MNQIVTARGGRGLFVLALILLAGLVLGAMAPATAVLAGPGLQASTTVAVTPAQVSVACQQETRVEIRINDVTNLFGVDMRLSYDPNVVEVVDANNSAPGIQIQSGDRPDVSGGQGLVQTNTVDPATGTINYAAIRLNPAPAQSGNGVIAVVTFKGLAAGTSPVTLVSVVLSDNVARPIQATLTNGQISVTCTGTPGTPPTLPVTTLTPGHGRPTATPTPRYGQPTPPGGGNGHDCTYIVKPGETLYGIARLYGSSAPAIAAANGLANLNIIYAGQRLIIPGCGGTGQPPVDPGKPPYDPGKPPYDPGYPPSDGNCVQYVVKPGQTLSMIAAQTGDNVYAIAQRNKLVNPNLIFAGQVLIVCPGGIGKPPIGQPYPGKPPVDGCRAVHIVKPYDTLYRISMIYGSNVLAIAARNNIANPNLIYTGQQLCIP